MSIEHYGTCKWSPERYYESHTPYGTVDIFNEGGQRAVELMLLSAAACLNFFLVEYAQSRKITVRHAEVTCTGEVVRSPERVARIYTHVVIDGDLDDKELRKMVTMCEKACKVMNTFKQPPEVEVHVQRLSAPGATPPARTKSQAGAETPADRTQGRGGQPE